MTSPTPRKRRKEARPSELLAAALDLFVEKGFSATRLDDVAARAGVSKGTLYLYYTSKEALFEAVIREGVIPLLAEAEAKAASHSGSSFELLSDILLGWSRSVSSTGLSGILKLIVCEARNFPAVAEFYYENVIRRARSLIGGAIERGMRDGEFREMDVETCIDVVFAPSLMMLIWQHSIVHCHASQGRDPEAVLEAHLGILRAGLVRA